MTIYNVSSFFGDSNENYYNRENAERAAMAKNGVVFALEGITAMDCLYMTFADCMENDTFSENIRVPYTVV